MTMKLATRPAGPARHGTAGLTVLGAATFIGVSTEILPVGLLPQISADLSVSESVAGLTVTGYALVVALSATPLTVLTARWPRRRLLLTVLIVYAFANALAAVAPTFAVLLVARAVGGLCHGVFWSMNTGYAVRLVSRDRVGRATGAVFTGSALAVAVGLPLATATGEAFGWRITTLGAAAITVAIAVSARVVLPPLEGLPTAAGHHRITAPVRAALARPGVRAVATITGLIVLGLYVFFSYISVCLGNLGLRGPEISAALLAYGVGGVLGTIALGRAYDRWPTRSFAAVVITLLAALAAIATLPLFEPAAWLTVAAIGVVTILGAAALSIALPLQAMIFAHAGPAPDAASSLFVAAFNVGISAGAAIGGVLLFAFGSHVLAPAALLIAAVGALRSLRAPHPQGT